MTELSPAVTRMREIVADNAALLKREGFRKRRTGFNREVADGLVQVVYFWMAPKEPPAWTPVPGLRERLYGTFRIDFGVRVPEMTRRNVFQGSWTNIYNCHLQESVGDLMNVKSPGGFLWDLDDPDASNHAAQGLTDFGLPWLDQFRSATDIIDAFQKSGWRPMGLYPASALDIVDLLRARGDMAQARVVIEQYVGSPVLHTHAEYLEGYLKGRGYDDLVPMITTRAWSASGS